MMKSYCQPFSPPTPCSSSSAPDTGPPIMVASGTAAMNKAMIRALSRAGNQ